MSDLTKTQQLAHELYDAGFNIYPMVKSNCVSHAPLYYNRISKDSIDEIFEGDCKIRVVTGDTSQGLVVLKFKDLDVFHNYVDNAWHGSIFLPIWAAQSTSTGYMWFRTNVELEHTIPQPNQGISIHTINRYTGIPDEVVAPMGDLNGIHWLPGCPQDLPSLVEIQVRFLDPDHIIQFVTPHERETPQYELDIQQQGFEEDWDFQRIEAEIERQRALHQEGYQNRHYFWEYVLAYIVQHWSWLDQQGISDLHVISGLLQHVSINGRRRFHAPIRLISVFSHVSKDTVSDSFDRIKVHNPPILNHVNTHPLSDTYFYEFNPEIIDEGRSLHRGVDLGHRFSLLSDLCFGDTYREIIRYYPDILEKKAFGYLGMLVYLLLDQEGGLTVGEIAKHLGVSDDTAKRKCKRLVKLNALYQGADHRYKIRSRDWYGFVLQAGVEGKTNSKKEHFQREREERAAKKILKRRRWCEETK